MLMEKPGKIKQEYSSTQWTYFLQKHESVVLTNGIFTKGKILWHVDNAVPNS